MEKLRGATAPNYTLANTTAPCIGITTPSPALLRRACQSVSLYFQMCHVLEAISTETSGHQRWMLNKPQCKVRYAFPTRLIKHHNMFLEGERHSTACCTRFLCPPCRLAAGFKMLPVGCAQQDGFCPCQPRDFWKAVWRKAM